MVKPQHAFLALALACLAHAADATDSITAEGMVDAPVSEVWSAWTTSTGLRSWLAPHAEIDLRIDGLMRSNYKASGTLGDKDTIVNRVLSYEPQRMLSIRVAKAPEGFPFPNAVASMWTVLYFDERSPGKTHVRIVGMGFTRDEESQRMRAAFDSGNAYTLGQLQRRFQR